MDYSDLLLSCEGFDWDSGNTDKNWIKHQVSQAESEQVFFNQPIILVPDEKHSQQENRFFVLGRSSSGRYLIIVFTVRENKWIRVISARDMSKKERVSYEKNT